MWQADLTGGARARLRRRGQGRSPARAAGLRRRGLDPARRQRRVAERQRRRGVASLRGAPEARWLTRRSISSTATTCSTPAAIADRRESTDALAIFRRAARGAGRARLGRHRRRRGDRAALGPARAACGRDAGAARSRAPRHRASSASSPPTSPSRARPGRRCRSAPRARSSRTSTGRAHDERRPSRLGDALDAETRARLERLRRGDDT